jgi:DNA-binding CsgD family transcriptional regulator
MFVSETRQAIAELHQLGWSNPAIARRLGLALTTVSYHVGRLRATDAEQSSPEDAAVPSAVHSSSTRSEVARLLALGLSRTSIANRLGVSKATVSYHARRLGEAIDDRCARRYDWAAVQAYYDRGHSVRQCIAAFGFSAASWANAVRREAILPRPNAIPISELFVANTYRGRFNLKLRLIKEGLKQNCCERCGLSEWRGDALTLALHHVNGERTDNRLGNLQLLCPNCHSQTENFAGRRRNSSAGG